MSIADNVEINQVSNFENLMFGQRVAYAIETSGISKAWIADKLGISKQALNYLLKHSIKPKFIDEFAELLELDPTWLETGMGTPNVKNKKNLQSSFITAIPIRTKLELLNNAPVAEKNRETIEFSRANIEAFMAYKLQDDSNFPPFIEGSILIFDTSKCPSNDDYVLVIINEDIYFRQFLLDGSNICYKAGNSGHKTFINPKAKVLGILVEARYQPN